VRVVSEWVKEGGKGASTEVLVINKSPRAFDSRLTPHTLT
jgi:hypothetical protein